MAAREINRQLFPYIVVLKQKNRRRLEMLGLLSTVLFVLLQVRRIYEFPNTRVINVLVLAVVAGIVANTVIRLRRGKKGELRVAYLVAGLALLLIPPFHFLSLLFIVMALLDKAAFTPEEIGFGQQEIVFNSIIPKKYKWTAFRNVVLKDGILTLDFLNDRLIQRETDDDEEEEEYDVSEEEFNAWVQERLAFHQHDQPEGTKS